MPAPDFSFVCFLCLSCKSPWVLVCSGQYEELHASSMCHIEDYMSWVDGVNNVFHIADPECHKIASKHELQQAVAIVGYWQGLCQSLGVADAVINNLVYSSNHDEEKKRQCLNSFFDMGDVCWEAVVIAVAKYPINNPRQARKIAKEYNVDYTKLKVKGEL